jgi:hypothetical protein
MLIHVRVGVRVTALYMFAQWLDDTQHRDTQHNDIRYNDTQHKGIICDAQHQES